MIDKPLEQITFADVERLVQERWPESKTVDYKRDAYGTEGDDKRELLKDVSSFANTQGGDIIIGVDEDKGVPTGIPGIAINDVDKEKLRLAEIIRNGIEPRIEFDIRSIATPTVAFVIIIRMKESLLFPHRVVFHGKFGEFWARHSSGGKFTMDTDELRRAFTLSDSIYEQIRAFRKNRVNQIEKGDTPMPLIPGGKLVLHLIPVSSFRSRQVFNVAEMPQMPTQFPPIGNPGASHLNLDGHVSYGGGGNDGPRRAYTQFFRNGIVEAVMADVVRDDEKLGKVLRAEHIEQNLLNEYQPFARFLKSLGEVGVQPPIWSFLTVTGVKGARIYMEDQSNDEFRLIDRDILMLPEQVIDDLRINVVDILRPTFDLMWNAAGFNRSLSFDSDGKWAKPSRVILTS